MSREIKFAFWNKQKKEMWSVQSVDWKTREVCNGGDIAGLNDGVLLQYTGLKDKDGKEIYEGDVVRIWADPKDYNGYKGHNYIGVVEWDEFILGFILSDGHGLKDFEFIEIVGNIYENPELLNKKGEQWKNHIIIIKNF